MFLSRKTSFISGVVCGLSFAPVYFFPGIFMLSVLCSQISLSRNAPEAAKFGYVFGFGFFLSTLYWISFALSVYIDQFWWAIPFALFGLPAFLALFIGAHSYISWQFKTNYFYHFVFCCTWVLFEWILSFAFTGFPWAMIGYAFSISDIIIQSASIFGILGLSFSAIYIGSCFFTRRLLLSRILVSLVICIAMIIFGYERLQNNPTEYNELKVRIVQPSIPQIAKWNPQIFLNNLYKHVELSQKPGDPDIIVWSEAALTVPHYYKSVHDALMPIFSKNNQVLLSGGVNDNSLRGSDYEIYSSMIAINSNGELLFDYHKSHLVPFGEYIPLSDYIPLQKLTPGAMPYTEGKRFVAHLKNLDLYIHPLICYESIFSEEVCISNKDADIMINVTNDSWYGNSSGPYQHFEISRMRSVENGLPMVRAANNGISAIIDPSGRVLKSLELDQIDIIDSNIPLKLSSPTIYSEWGYKSLFAYAIFALLLQFIIIILVKKLY
ncbi:MAG: apolipoprotein N-acyltransferase [Rickettsiaceae bacterium]|nr:apolipoprotein N-acyltransferase [Rickettsiaceae bacterium]